MALHRNDWLRIAMGRVFDHSDPRRRMVAERIFGSGKMAAVS